MSNQTEPNPVSSYLVLTDSEASAVLSQMPSDMELSTVCDLFRVFADPTRIRILYALLQQEMCVSDISRLLSVSQSAVSHQLQILRLSALIKTQRAGRTVFYSLADDHVSGIIAMGLDHIRE